MLEDRLFPWMQMHHVLQFLQDGAPCHKAKRVMALLAMQDLTVIDWLGNSPDLNLIEKKWAQAKAIRRRVGGTIDDLFNGYSL